MNVTNVTFANINHELLKLRVTINGEGFIPMATKITGMVGECRLSFIISLPDADGVMGFLTEIPNEGDVLFIGYADHELTRTEFTYHPPLTS
jgi:hypothetical protein